MVERQREPEAGEFKYVIHGPALTNRTVGLVAKLSLTDKLVIITVYEA